MKPGIRLQLGVALVGLFVLAFVPLYFAVARLAAVRFQVEHAREAQTLLRVVGAADDPERAARAALEGSRTVSAIAAYGADGKRRLGVGDEALPETLDPTPAEGRVVVTRGGLTWVARIRENAGAARPFSNLVALYTLLMAGALLALTYFVLTRFVVGPLDQLAQGARRVTRGSRSLPLPTRGARELLDLGRDMSEMTDKLHAEEEALRGKVAELERLAQELRASQQSLVRSERLASVGRLAAGLAHEVGNPLAAVLGLEELLLSGDLTPEEQKDFLMRMHRETERIHRIVRDLLDFARAGHAPTSSGGEERGDVTRVVGDVMSLLAPQKVMRDVDLELDVETELAEVKLSHEHLTQVLLNLVSNAAEATGEGGRVKVTAKAKDRAVELVVEDDGPGIAKDVEQNLFEPFVTTKEVGKGTGLGLAVCKGLVEGAGGTIVVAEGLPQRAGEGRGARFVVTLPFVSRG